MTHELTPLGPVTRSLSSLTPADFAARPVWELLLDEEGDDQMVRSVERVPVDDPEGMRFGTLVRLADGSQRLATLGNISPDNAARTEQFITLALPHAEGWFHLARYFDPTWEEEGPEMLASLLGLPTDSVFPISYDLRPLIRGDEKALVGAIDELPRKRLSDEQIMDLLFLD